MSLKGLIKKFSVRNRKVTNENVDDVIKSDNPLKVNAKVLYTNYNNTAFTQGRQRPICIISIDYDSNNIKSTSQLNELLILLNISYDRAITSSENNKITILSTLNNFVNTVTEGYKREHDNNFIVAIYDALHEFDDSIFSELKSLGLAKDKPYSVYYTYNDNGFKDPDTTIPTDKVIFICSETTEYIPVIDFSIQCFNTPLLNLIIKYHIPIISVYTSYYNGIKFLHFVVMIDIFIKALSSITEESTTKYNDSVLKNILDTLLENSDILEYYNSDKFKNNNSEGEYDYHLYEDIEEIIK